MPPVIESMELAQVLAEAEDIARNVNQKLTSAHQLLALFTVPNRAELLLKERGIDEDKILLAMTGAPREPEGVERDLRERARDVADGLGAAEADCLHLLIAMSRVRTSAAHQLLADCGVQLATLRNVALSYFTARMPRRLRRLEPQPVSSAGPAPPARPSRGPERGGAALEGGPGAEGAPGAGESAEPTLSPGPAARPAPPARPVPLLRPEPAAGPRPAPGPCSLDPEAFPWLASLGRNLSELACSGRLDPLVGREREVEEVIDILGKRRTNNPLLVGEPGVGKTAIVEGVAQRWRAGRGVDRLLVELDVAGILAGTQLRGSFSEKLNGIKNEVRRAAGRVVVFIDEVHTLIGAGATGEGPQDAANELKAALARGVFPCVGATTHDEYRRYIERDPALERRFTPVLVREPSVPETVRILEGLAARYEQHHGVRFPPEALEAAASLSARYIGDRFLPDKAVAVLDLAGSRARRLGARQVHPDAVAEVVAQMANIPASRLVAADRERVLGLEAALGERIVGHRQALGRVALILKRNYAGFSARRPLGSFLLLGPAGVGKTEMGRAIAEALHGGVDALVRLDMSECSEQTGVSRLIGAPPGYVGYGEGGQLTDAVRRRPASVVLFDEIEKAHRDVLMLLLQILEEGRLTDGRGRLVDFGNAVVVLTSNLGGDGGSAAGPIGFAAAGGAGPRGERALSAARGALPAELWDRLDERIVLEPLSPEELAGVARKLLAESSARLAAERKIRFAVDDEVVRLLVERCRLEPALGARPVRGAVQRLVEAPLAERILAGDFGPGDRIRVGAAGGALRFTREP